METNNLRQRRKEFFSDLQKIVQKSEKIFDDNSLPKHSDPLSDSDKNENNPQKQTTNNLPIPSSNDIPLTYFSIQQQFTANLTPKPFLTLSECNFSSTSTFSIHNHNLAGDNNIITEEELKQTKAYFLQQLETTNQRLKTDSLREILLQQAPHLFNSTFFKRRNLMIEDLLTKDISSSD